MDVAGLPAPLFICGRLSLRTAFFLIFIFEWKGWIGSTGAFLGCISFLPSFDCFRLRSFSTGFLASLRGRMSLRTAFFFNFHF